MAKIIPRLLKFKSKHRVKKKKRAHIPKHAIEPILVSWMSKFEWQTVKQKIFSSEVEDKIFALNRLSAWKSRSRGRIPLGIEVTDALLRAYVRDLKAQNSEEAQILHGDLVMMYSSAIIRFVNLVTEVGQKGDKKTPVNILAQRMNIPEWLVDLRHEASHTNFPALSTLQAAFHLAMNWIEVKFKHYWNDEASRMSDIPVKGAVDTFIAKSKSNCKFSPTKQKCKSWELATEDVNWKDYPLGILPDQLEEIPFLDLSLPVCVDRFYSHQAAVLTSCAADISDTESVEEEEQNTSYEMPNLEDRLHIKRYTKRTLFWTKEQFKAIQSALVIF
uniref:Ribosomal biogenesis protein LAS1L n=1 Tax=Strigamia maritima TaxID=126957 RepID=T1JAT4_STRMM